MTRFLEKNLFLVVWGLWDGSIGIERAVITSHLGMRRFLSIIQGVGRWREKGKKARDTLRMLCTFCAVCVCLWAPSRICNKFGAFVTGDDGCSRIHLVPSTARSCGIHMHACHAYQQCLWTLPYVPGLQQLRVSIVLQTRVHFSALPTYLLFFPMLLSTYFDRVYRKFKGHNIRSLLNFNNFRFFCLFRSASSVQHLWWLSRYQRKKVAKLSIC